MAGSKSVKNAGEAAARAAGKANAPRSPKVDWVARGNDLGIDSVAARELDEVLIPELQAAGYPAAQIKALLDEPDPHLAAKQFIADERAALGESLRNSDYGLTPEQIDSTSLRDLKETVKDAMGGKSRPSGIRGKDPEASQTVESRLPETPAEKPAPQAPAEPPKRDPMQELLALGYMADGSNPTGIGSGVDVISVPATFRADASPGAGLPRPVTQDIEPGPLPTPSMQELDAAIRGVKTKGKPAKQAKPLPLDRIELDPNRARLATADMSGVAASEAPLVVGRGLDSSQPVALVSPAQQKLPAAGGGQPAPPPEVDSKPPQKGPSIADTDPTLVYGRKGLGALKTMRDKAPVTGALGAATLGATAYFLRNNFGGKQPTDNQQQSSPASRPQIYIIPRDKLREMEMRQAPRPMPPAQQAPVQPATQAAPGDTTNIIRQLTGRMA